MAYGERDEVFEHPAKEGSFLKSLFAYAESSPCLWVYPEANHSLVDKIAKEYHLPSVLAKILVNRGITTEEQIHNLLYAKLPDLIDPFLFSEMPQAVERIAKAIRAKETVVVYGDNDVDGMTGTALLVEFLNYIGVTAVPFISSRAALLRQSLILDALEFALRVHATLIITVDCGITAAAQIEELIRHKIDVIVTDHHEPTDKIPHCIATLNPKLVTSEYPNRDLTGVGVAFKLIHAMTQYLNQNIEVVGGDVSGDIPRGEGSQKKIDLKRYLDLVAIGTVADMGVLTGENRILVSYGLQQLRRNKRLGLSKLLAICDLDPGDITTTTIASKIAPKLNSLGRLAEPENGVKLLMTRNQLTAEKMAVELNLYNIERQQIERKMTKDIAKLFEANPSLLKHKAIVLSSRKWHPGIIAILAMRLAKYFNRPAIIIAIEGQIGKGSIRSIPEFPVLGVLRELSSLLINYGGHDVAAGFAIRESFIEEFSKQFIMITDRTLSDHHVIHKLTVDAEVSFKDLTFDFMEALTLLEPYGHGNPAPVFYSNVTLLSEPKQIGRQHVKLLFEQGDRVLEGVAFGLGQRFLELHGFPKKLKIAFTPQSTGSSIQLLVRDFQLE